MDEEHRIRLRAAWEWSRADHPDGPVRRIDLPCAWPAEWTTAIHLRRLFGAPSRSTGRAWLCLDQVPGVREVVLNGMFLAGPEAIDAGRLEIELVDGLKARNLLELRVGPCPDPAFLPTLWGEVSLVFRGR